MNIYICTNCAARLRRKDYRGRWIRCYECDEVAVYQPRITTELLAEEGCLECTECGQLTVPRALDDEAQNGYRGVAVKRCIQCGGTSFREPEGGQP